MFRLQDPRTTASHRKPARPRIVQFSWVSLFRPICNLALCGWLRISWRVSYHFQFPAERGLMRLEANAFRGGRLLGTAVETPMSFGLSGRFIAMAAQGR